MAHQPIEKPSNHATLDIGSRNLKARKVERLLNLRQIGRPLRLLEIGTGSGGIADYFGNHPTLQCDVDAVDISDNRQVRGSYRFTLVSDVQLPFPDNHFDVVLSNHVIEHVGGQDAQYRHLTELRRVLTQSGRGYLAVPNRWQWVEPHYHIAGLSWMPEHWRTPYLRWRQRGDCYDCRPLTVAQVEAMLCDAKLAYQQQHARALKTTYELEQPNAMVYALFFQHLPDGIYAYLRRLFPTLIYVLKRVDQG